MFRKKTKNFLFLRKLYFKKKIVLILTLTNTSMFFLSSMFCSLWKRRLVFPIHGAFSIPTFILFALIVLPVPSSALCIVFCSIHPNSRLSRLSLSLSVCLSLCLSVCLSVSLSLCLSVSLSVCLLYFFCPLPRKHQWIENESLLEKRESKKWSESQQYFFESR